MMSNHELNNPLKKEKRLQVGLFIGGGLLSIVLVLFVLARSEGWFEQSYALVFYADSAESLNKGMVVRLSGLPIGKVVSISLEDDARVRVQMQINDDFQRWIKGDSAASLAREGMFGDSYIQISAGKRSSKPLVGGAVLAFDPRNGVSELLQQLRGRLFPLLEEMQSLVVTLKSPDGQLGGTLKEASALLHELRSTRVQIDKALLATTTLAGRKIPATLEQVEGSLASFKTVAVHADTQLADLSKQLQITLDKYEQVGGNADIALKELQVTLKETRPSLQKALRDVDVLMHSANQTMINMNEHWPFSGDAKPASMPESAP